MELSKMILVAENKPFIALYNSLTDLRHTIIIHTHKVSTVITPSWACTSSIIVS